MRELTAISLIQPWAWLMLRPDITDPAQREAARAAGRIKDMENREWMTDRRGWVLLHASSTKYSRWDWAAHALFAAKRGVEIPLQGSDSMPMGAYVGAVRIDDCRTYAGASRWFTGPCGLAIGAAVPFAKPVPGIGSLKFYQVPPPGAGVGGAEMLADIVREIRAAGLAEAFRISSSTT